MVDFLSRFLINSVQTATTGTVQFLFMLGVMLYSMFFFLMHGGRLLDLILYYVPLEDDEERLVCPRCDQARPSVCLVCGSARFANLRPGVSRPDPTWYQVFTVATGAEWSSWTMMVSPFGSRNIS